MNLLTKWNIKTKLLLLISLFSLFLVLVGATSYYYLQQLQNITLQCANSQAASNEAGMLLTNAFQCIGLLILLAIGSGIVFSLLIIKSILTPLTHLETCMSQVGDGDFTVKDTEHVQGELGKLIQIFNHMVANKPN